MRNGFNIIIGGKDFEPAKFITERLEPQHVQTTGEDRFLEFNDFEEGSYSLDMVAEAMGLLEIHRDYFATFKDEKTIEYKVINFFIEHEYWSLDLSMHQIDLLHELRFIICFTFTGPEK